MRSHWIFTALVGVAGCRSSSVPPIDDAHRVQTQPEAGSVHFAVLSVAPWKERAPDLVPDFHLNGDEAVAKVMPTTQASEDSFLDYLGLGVGGVSTRDSHGNDSSSSNGQNGGAQPSNPPTAPYARSNPLDGYRPATNEALAHPDSLGTEPMAQYWAAAALFQEVQLLNRVVLDAAVRSGFDAYLVRLQVTLMPRARNEPYDAYCTISFFSEGASSSDDVKSRALSQPIAADAPTTSSAAQVIPLLVTDSLERGEQARSRQNMAQLALAIDYFRSGLGVGADAQKLTARVQEVMGADLNSLLTVARVSDNTIRVRLGAMQQGSTQFAMVPRNHNISLLLMVPRGSANAMRALSKTTLVDAVTGAELPEPTDDVFGARLAEVTRTYGFDVAPQQLKPLLEHAEHNDWPGYLQAYAKVFKEPKFAESLWLDLVSVSVGSRYAVANFDLQGERLEAQSKVLAGIPQQFVILDEDIKASSANAGITARVAIDKLDSTDGLRATLIVEPKHVTLAARSLKIEEKTLVIQFPPLNGSDLAKDAAHSVNATLRLSLGRETLDLGAIYRLN